MYATQTSSLKAIESSDMEPVDLPEMSDGERRWVAAAFHASVNTKLVTKFQVFTVAESDNKKVTLSFGSAIEMSIFPGQPRTTACEVFGCYLIERNIAQDLVNNLAREFGITPQL